MKSRIHGIAAGLVIALLSLFAGTPARAVPVEIDLTINFMPNPPPIFQGLQLTGSYQFWSNPGAFDQNFSLFANPIGALAAGQSFSAVFIPTDPCFGLSSCAIGFSFGGNLGIFTAEAFAAFDANLSPNPPPIIPVGTLAPGDPCFQGAVCHASGVIVGFDAPLEVGTWDVTIQAQTPLPAALPLFATGLGALGLLGWRRRRKAN